MTTPLDLVADNRKWVRLHENNAHQAEAARRITALLAEVERLRADRDEQGRFLSAVADAVRTTGLSVSEVLSALGVKTERDRLTDTLDWVRAVCAEHWEYQTRREAKFGRTGSSCICHACEVMRAIEGTDS